MKSQEYSKLVFKKVWGIEGNIVAFKLFWTDGFNKVLGRVDEPFLNEAPSSEIQLIANLKSISSRINQYKMKNPNSGRFFNACRVSQCNVM